MGFSPKLEKELLILWIVDALRRTLVHYGYWLKRAYHSIFFSCSSSENRSWRSW